MLKRLFPTAYYKRVFDIPLDTLKKNNIKGLVFDIDNTLAPYDVPEPDDETVAFIQKAAESGFSICLLSNNTKKRVSLYNEKLNLRFVAQANKPFTRGLKKAMALIGTDRKTTVLIGDQIFTDILCGNRAGVRTILIEPCAEYEQWYVKVKRILEKKIIKNYLESRDINGRN